MTTQGFKNKRTRLLPTWIKIATDYNAALSIDEIRKRNPNPKTGKPYSRVHIHKILRELKKMELSKLVNKRT
jgi:hypothetical protein